MVQVRTNEGLLVLEGSGRVEKILREAVSDTSIFRTAKAKDENKQLFISLKDYGVELNIGMKIYLWVGTKIIFSEA